MAATVSKENTEQARAERKGQPREGRATVSSGGFGGAELAVEVGEAGRRWQCRESFYEHC